MKKVTIVDNRNSHSNIELTNCNTKVPTTAIFVLVANTRLNTFWRYRAFGLISDCLLNMC